MADATEVTADEIRALQYGVDPRRQGWQAAVLDAFGRSFLEDAHPLTPWASLRWARVHGLATPEWVLEYFCSRGDEINRIVMDGSSQHPEADAVGRVLGFGSAAAGGKSSSYKAKHQAMAWQLAVGVELELSQHTSVEAAIAATRERFGVSDATIYRARAEFGPQAAKFVADLIASHQ